MKKCEKKILIVNVSYAGQSDGTGLTLKNIFSCMSQECLMQICLQNKEDSFKTSIFNTVFLDDNELPIRKLILKNRKMKPAGQMVSVSIPKKNIGSLLRNAASGFLDMEKVHLSEKKMDLIKKFSPDVIYTAGSSARVHSTVNYLAKRFHIPIILHLMDDWPETIYTASILSLIPRIHILSLLKKTNELTVSNFAISRPLCKKYEKLYGKKYVELMNPVIHLRKEAKETVQEVSTVTFLYAGSLSLGREISLLKVAKAIHDVNNNQIKTSFQLYVPGQLITKELICKFEKYCAIVNPYIPNEELQGKYDNANILVHVESFMPEFLKFTRYSLSTKIPEYMGVGKPLLAFLPKEQYGYSYIIENDAGRVAYDETSLSKVVNELVQSRKIREQLGAKALDCAMKKHSLNSVKIKFNEAIS